MKNFKDVKFSEDFQIESGRSDYEFHMKKSSYWWLWILGLMVFMLLCCVKCNHSIDVKTADIDSGENVVCDSVTINYTSHYLYKDGRFFVNETHSITQAPDADGVVHFSDMPCSVFSYIFYAFSSAEYTIENGCYVLPEPPTEGLFHYKWSQTLKLATKTTDLVLTVIDRDTGEPLADAMLQYSFNRGGKTVNDSIKSDAAGRCNLTAIPTCGSINISRASCYAYQDTSNVSISVIEALSDDEIATIPLTPLKESFTFFVHNKYTHQPIPDAKVEIVLKNKNNVVRHGPISTNVDGTGRGTYNDAFIGASLELKASKTNYKDSIYTPICTVKEFIDKPDSLRVIYLEPLPYNQTFVNADSISHEPIAGVMNHIVVKSMDGNEYKYDEPSNRQGVFTFKAMEGDHIVIDSKLDPQYEPKHTEIAKFEKGDTIFMKPRVADLTFRTIKIAYLMQAPQSERDIPLVEGLEPCNASNSGASDVKAGAVSKPQSYNMGQKDGTFDLSWSNGGSCPDKIDVYNHEPGESYDTHSPIFTTGMTAGDGASSIRFSYGSVITIVVTTGPSDGSSWEYKLGCPK